MQGCLQGLSAESVHMTMWHRQWSVRCTNKSIESTWFFLNLRGQGCPQREMAREELETLSQAGLVATPQAIHPVSQPCPRQQLLKEHVTAHKLKALNVFHLKGKQTFHDTKEAGWKNNILE